VAVSAYRHLVKLEKEALDLGLVNTTTTKSDEQVSSTRQNTSKS